MPAGVPWRMPRSNRTAIFERPETLVTKRTGHMGNTFRPRQQGRWRCPGRSVRSWKNGWFRCPPARRRGHDRPAPRVRHFTQNRLQILTASRSMGSRPSPTAPAGRLWLASSEANGLERSTREQYRQHVELHIVPSLVSPSETSSPDPRCAPSRTDCGPASAASLPTHRSEGSPRATPCCTLHPD